MIISERLLQGLNCIKIGGELRLQFHKSTVCYSDDHPMTLIVVGILVYPVGLLCLMTYFMVWVRDKISDENIIQKYGALIRYKKQFYWYELVCTSSRFFVSAATALFAPEAFWSLNVMFLLQILEMVIVISFRPYLGRLDNLLAAGTALFGMFATYGGILSNFGDATVIDKETLGALTVIGFWFYVAVLGICAVISRVPENTANPLRSFTARNLNMFESFRNVGVQMTSRKKDGLEFKKVDKGHENYNNPMTARGDSLVARQIGSVEDSEGEKEKYSRRESFNHHLKKGWFAAIDESSGSQYFFNEVTGETTWSEDEVSERR
jgi:hypothetical protein